MLNTLLKCPNKFVCSRFLKETLSLEQKIKTYGLRAGHIETDLHQAGFDITLTTNRYFIWEFWRCLINSPQSLLRDIKFFHKNLTSLDVSQYRHNWYAQFHDPYERAAIFYLLNRYSKNGKLLCKEMSKHNFSNLNLLSFESMMPMTKDLKLSFTSYENLIFSFKEVEEDTTIVFPIGSCKRNYILKKEVKSIDESNYDLEKIKQFLESKQRRMFLIFKFDPYVDGLFDNKIYINKFGEVTEDPLLAADLIATNVDYG